MFGRKPAGLVKTRLNHCLSEDKNGEAYSVDGEEFFVGEGGAEVGVFGPDQVQGTIQDVGVDLVIGGLASKAMNNALGPFQADIGAEAPDLALRKIQLPGGFGPGHSPLQDTVNRF
jgi:hypothetical protein